MDGCLQPERRTREVTVGLGRDTPHYEPLVPSFGKGVDLRNDP